jgi:hypothetical protein
VTSRLASLLVQDGLVSAKKMAEAFQRQVIYGGTLDTILLEMDVIDESVLTDALGRASALPIAGDLPEKAQLAGAAEWLPRALSERFRAAPVSLDSNVLRVLVTDPPDRVQLDELGYLVGRSIDPVVVTEHRFVQLVEVVYGVAAPARFASLSARLAKRRLSPTPREVRPPRTEPLLTPAEQRALTEPRTQAPPPAQAEPPPPAQPEPPPAQPAPPPVEEPRRAVVSDVPMPGAPKPVTEEPTPRLTPRQSGAPAAQVSADVAVRVDAGAPGDAAPTALDEAQRLIDQAADRDAIFAALCRGARSQLQFAALFTVHGETAAGRLALGDAWLDAGTVAGVTVALDRPSPFRAAVHGRSPYLGRLGEEAIGAKVLAALGRKPPLPGALVPITLRDRTVALLYGDAGGQPVDGALLAGLTTLTAAAARSFQRLILRAKGGEYAKAPTTPSGPSGKLSTAPAEPGTATAQPTKRRGTVPGFAAFTPVKTPSEPIAKHTNGHATASLHEADTAKIVHRDGAARTAASTDLNALVDSVLAGDERSSISGDALVLLGDRGARAVVARLPGPLRLARHALRGPTPPLTEHGPLLSLVSRFGSLATPALTERANDESLEVRYYVTLALGELRLRETIPTLGQRALDADAGVRHVAIEALARAEASPELRTLTESLRGELPGPDVRRQQYAAEALGAMHDTPSVPRIIELTKHAHATVATAARRALIEITKQDFGTSRWRWRSWWERHRDQPRLEWMLEGLGHAEADVRLSASEELKTLGGGEYFGYHFDLPRREREEARRKWVDWWRSRGDVK